jgi:hypothetical protein
MVANDEDTTDTTETTCEAIPHEFADDPLVELVARYQGAVTKEQLCVAGYTESTIQHLLDERVLIALGNDSSLLGFPDPTLYYDALVLVHWQLPDAVFGGLTALERYHLTVALPNQLVAYVPADTLAHLLTRFTPVVAGPPQTVEVPTGTAATGLDVRLLTLPLHLARYGIQQFAPEQPGTVSVAMYTPAVALAQALADPDAPAEWQQDAVSGYLNAFGRNAALDDAVQRYAVLPVLLHAIAAIANY